MKLRTTLLLFLCAVFTFNATAQRREVRWNIKMEKYQVTSEFDSGTHLDEAGIEITFDFGACPAWVHGGVTVEMTIWHERDIFNPTYGCFINGARNLDWSKMEPVLFYVKKSNPKEFAWYDLNYNEDKQSESVISRYSPDWLPIKIRIPWNVIKGWDLPEPREGIYDLPVNYYFPYIIYYDGHKTSSIQKGRATPYVTCYHYPIPDPPRHETVIVDLGTEDLSSLFDEEPKQKKPAEKDRGQGKPNENNDEGGKEEEPHIHELVTTGIDNELIKKIQYDTVTVKSEETVWVYIGGEAVHSTSITKEPDYYVPYVHSEKETIPVMRSFPDSLWVNLGGEDKTLFVLHDKHYYRTPQAITPRQVPFSIHEELEEHTAETDTIPYYNLSFDLAHAVTTYLNDSISQPSLPQLNFKLPVKTDIKSEDEWMGADYDTEEGTDCVLSADGELFLRADVTKWKFVPVRKSVDIVSEVLVTGYESFNCVTTTTGGQYYSYTLPKDEIFYIEKPSWEVRNTVHKSCPCGQIKTTSVLVIPFKTEEAAKEFMTKSNENK